MWSKNNIAAAQPIGSLKASFIIVLLHPEFWDMMVSKLTLPNQNFGMPNVQRTKMTATSLATFGKKNELCMSLLCYCGKMSAAWQTVNASKHALDSNVLAEALYICIAKKRHLQLTTETLLLEV
jgi:hypothetical protein